MPSGYPRLFDSGRATNSTGYGTPDLSDDYDNALTIQAPDDVPPWTANEGGGIFRV